MPQKIAFFDLDGTLFRWQLYHELVFELKNQGVFDHEVAESLDQALIDWQAKRGTWNGYESEVINAFQAVLPSLKPSQFDNAVQIVAGRSGHKIYNYTKQLLDSLKGADYYTLAISGSQQEIAATFARQYGFDDCIATVYERNNGRFTGNITRFTPDKKHQLINEFLKTHPNIILQGSIAIGDSESDISMLEMVDRPIAFNPSEKLLSEALNQGWEIVIERKNIAYTLQMSDNNRFELTKTKAFQNNKP